MSATSDTGAVPERRVHIPKQGGRLIPWQKGQSGNIFGTGVENAYNEARRICADASAEGARKQVKLMSSEDERVAFMATEAVLNRGAGKPRDHSNDQTTRIDLSGLSVDDQRTLADLLRKALGV
jgi:hypothetical protein